MAELFLIVVVLMLVALVVIAARLKNLIKVNAESHYLLAERLEEIEKRLLNTNTTLSDISDKV